MRDPARIEQMLSLIHQIWRNSPDMRFNQLIYNLQAEYSAKRSGIGRVQELSDDGLLRTGFDLFHLEDTAFLKFLHERVRP